MPVRSNLETNQALTAENDRLRKVLDHMSSFGCECEYNADGSLEFECFSCQARMALDVDASDELRGFIDAASLTAEAACE